MVIFPNAANTLSWWPPQQVVPKCGSAATAFLIKIVPAESLKILGPFAEINCPFLTT
jgi:hypothetical protein